MEEGGGSKEGSTAPTPGRKARSLVASLLPLNAQPDQLSAAPRLMPGQGSKGSTSLPRTAFRVEKPQSMKVLGLKPR